MAYEDFKDLTRRTAFDEILHDKTFNIAKNLKYDEDQYRRASMAHKFSDKKTAGGKKLLLTMRSYKTRN